MFTAEEYQNAWLMYLGGVVLMFACWYYLTRFIVWPEVRQLLRIFVAVLFLVPWFTEASSGYLAPAIIIAIVETLTMDGAAFWRAGTPLLVALTLSVALSLLWNLWQWRRQAKASA